MPYRPCAPPRMHAKARHHLVEDQHGAMAVAHRAQARQELRARHDEVHVADDRLDDDARDALAVGAKRGLDRREIVERKHDGFVGDGGRHARRRRRAERERARARLHEQAVAVSVVAAFELHDLAAARVAAREPQRRHRGLGARRDEAHELDRRQQAAERLRHLDLHFGRRAERQSVPRRRDDRFHDRRMRVAEDGRPPGADVVEIALAVGIPQVGAFAARDEARRAADGSKRAHRGVDAGGNRALRTGEELFVAVHGGPLGVLTVGCGAGRQANTAAMARAAAVTSGASNTAEITATRMRAGARELARVVRGDAADGDDGHAERGGAAQAARRRRDARPVSRATGKKLPNAT